MDATTIRSFRKRHFHFSTYAGHVGQASVADGITVDFIIFCIMIIIIVKWCSGAACNCYVSLDIALILTLMRNRLH